MLEVDSRVGLGNSHEEIREKLRVGRRGKHITMDEAVDHAHRYRRGEIPSAI
jgi:hypothetical protein